MLDRVGGQEPRRLHLAAQPAERLFVEYLGRAAGQPLIGDQAHRVRADVDNRDRRAVVETALGVGSVAAHRSLRRNTMPTI